RVSGCDESFRSGIKVPEGAFRSPSAARAARREAVLAQLVVDAARRHAEQPSRLGLIVAGLAHGGSDNVSFASGERLAKMPLALAQHCQGRRGDRGMIVGRHPRSGSPIFLCDSLLRKLLQKVWGQILKPQRAMISLVGDGEGDQISQLAGISTQREQRQGMNEI